MLTAEFFRQRVDYNPETGVFVWKTNRYKSLVGSRLGTMTTKGYLIVRICGKNYLMHRLAFLHVLGHVPAMVDHINGDKSDNRWANLRAITPQGNVQNIRRATKSNKLGVLGVRLHCGRFRAQIKHCGETIYLGRFDTPEGAHDAYIAAKRRIHVANTL